MIFRNDSKEYSVAAEELLTYLDANPSKPLAFAVADLMIEVDRLDPDESIGLDGILVWQMAEELPVCYCYLKNHPQVSLNW